MSEIPEGVMKAAREIAAAAWVRRGNVPASVAKSILSGEEDDMMGVETAARAIMAERSRCAFIARNGCLVPPDGGEPTDAEREMCDGIAAAIRKTA